ncbi:MAG: ABC transporter permease [Acidaminobacteraceae bacterium]
MNKKWIYLFLMPGILLLVVFLIIPLFATIGDTFFVDGNISFSRYISFFQDEYYVEIYLRTLKLGVITTFLAVILGFPTSYYISRTNKKVRGLYIMFAVFPLLTSAVVRSFSWMVILGRKGIINTALLKIHIIDKPLSLLYNEFSIVTGLLYLFLPLMIMSLVGVMENIEGDLTEAAESLGASRFQAFMKVIFPLSVPGLIVGSILVFTGSITAYTTPQLLGGSKAKVLSTLIYQSAMTLFDWNTAAVVATIMIVTTIVVSIVINTLSSKINKSRG